jgi:prepilin-type N-terminal cleavage/methylation domain-containing protein
MTLVELLVVLTILAILAAVAMTATDVFVDQGRYDANARTLTSIQEAVVGPDNARQPDGTLLSTGFVADVGRLPMAVGTDPTTALAELWTIPNGLAAFAVRPAPSDGEVLVASGWRGPYLRLPVGRNSLRDGWGNSLDLLDAGGNTAAAGAPIASVRSRGADNAAGGSGGYDLDLSVTFATAMAVSGNVYLLDGSGRTNPTDPSQVHVTLFGPDPATGGVKETTVSVTKDPNSGVVSYSATTTLGPRCLRAYLGNPSTRKSAVVQVQRGGVQHLDIK